MLRAQLLGAKLNAILFPSFAGAYLPSGEQVQAVIAHADEILDDHANGILHDKSEITAVKDLLDAANNNSHARVLTTCPPGGSSPTPSVSTPSPAPSATPEPPGPCQDFSGGLTKGYWKTHTGLDSPPRDNTYDDLPIFLGVSPYNGTPEMNVDSEEIARDALSNANSSGHGYTMLRAQLLAAKLNAIKFPGFVNATLDSGEAVSEIMGDADTILNDAANGISHPKSEVVVIAGLLDSANNNSHSQTLYVCDLNSTSHGPSDYDGDGFSDEAEGLHIGTNAASACGNEGWPADLVPGGYQPNTLNAQDLASFVIPVRHLGTSPGDARFDARWDLVPGSSFGRWINIQDIAVLVSGPAAYPPMFGGLKAFGKACPESDSDSDSVINTADNCPAKPNANQSNWDADPFGDVCDESDQDGFLDASELHVGTDPGQHCGFDGWPADLYDGPPSVNRITIQDLASFVTPIRRLNKAPGDAGYDIRWDIVPGNGGFGKHINIADMGVIISLLPDMFGGDQRAYNGPACQP